MSELTMSDAQKEFHEWFLKNYPSACVISSPEWHAPKIYRAATHSLRAQVEALRGDLSYERDRNLEKVNAAVLRAQAAEARAEALRTVAQEMLDLSDNWPGIAYTDDLERRVKAALSEKRET